MEWGASAVWMVANSSSSIMGAMQLFYDVILLFIIVFDDIYYHKFTFIFVSVLWYLKYYVVVFVCQICYIHGIFLHSLYVLCMSTDSNFYEIILLLIKSNQSRMSTPHIVGSVFNHQYHIFVRFLELIQVSEVG